MAKKFVEMEKYEAVGVIIDVACRCNEILDSYDLNSLVRELAHNWNFANEGNGEIDVYPYAREDFNDGCDCGIGIEDDYIIFKRFQKAWDEYQENN